MANIHQTNCKCNSGGTGTVFGHLNIAKTSLFTCKDGIEEKAGGTEGGGVYSHVSKLSVYLHFSVYCV